MSYASSFSNTPHARENHTLSSRDQLLLRRRRQPAQHIAQQGRLRAHQRSRANLLVVEQHHHTHRRLLLQTTRLQEAFQAAVGAGHVVQAAGGDELLLQTGETRLLRVEEEEETHIQIVEEELEIEDGLGLDVHVVADILDQLLVVEGGVLFAILLIVI